MDAAVLDAAVVDAAVVHAAVVDAAVVDAAVVDAAVVPAGRPLARTKSDNGPAPATTLNLFFLSKSLEGRRRSVLL